jgi:hypothetical protein
MNNQKTDYIKSKFHPAIRIVAAILVVTFFFQDIAWAYPDDFRNLAITGLQNKAVRARLKAALIIELIEKRSALKDSLSNLKLDDILKWNRSTEKEFKDVAFKPIRDNGELKEVRLSINDGSEDIIISYFDSSYRHPEIIPAGYMDITDQITNPAVISANSLIQRQVLKATSLLPPPEGPAPAAPRQGKSFSGDRLSSAGLIAGIGLRPDAANREVDAALLEIADNADANAKLLKILGFTKKQLPILVKAMAETKPDLFGSKLNTAADLDSVPAIGPATIKAARDKIRLGAACCSKYKEAFANFIAMAYAINRKDTEDEVRSKIDKIFAESRHLLSNKEFIKDMSAYFEHDPDILLSLTYIIWAEIRAGPADYRRLFLVDKLRELAAGTDGAPLSYYRLAAMRYIAPWDRKKNALAIFVRLSIEFPEPGEFYDAIYKTLVELAMHGDLSVFYAFSQPNQRPKLAMLAVKAVAEARRGTDDLKKFLDAAKRHPDRKVQDTVKAAELSQPILPVIIAFPVIKGIPHPELLEKINPAKAKIIKNHLQLPDADLFLGRIMPSGVGKILRKGAEEYFDDGYVYGYIACLKAMRLWGDAVMTEDAGRSIFLPVYEAVANMHKHGGLGATIDIKMSEEDVLEVICDSEDPGHILKPEEMSAKTVLAHECVMESAGKKWERAAGGALKSGPSDKASGVRVTLRWRKPGVEALEVPAIEGPGAQNMAKARPSSDWRGDWVNPYIIEYIDEGRAVEIDEDGEKVKIIRRGGPNSRDGPAERALEGRFKSTGLFRKIEEAKEDSRRIPQLQAPLKKTEAETHRQDCQER